MVTITPENGGQTLIARGTQSLLARTGSATAGLSLVAAVQTVRRAVADKLSRDTGAVPAGELGLLTTDAPHVAPRLIIPVTTAVRVVSIADQTGWDTGVVSVAVELLVAALLGTACLVLAVITVNLTVTNIVRWETLVPITSELCAKALHVSTARVLVT